ncbi:MAG: hypothetical protein Q4F06_02185 [Eubacteriales bacterium]|nr:hypothetical protein [Eubacteriales bacterium]
MGKRCNRCRFINKLSCMAFCHKKINNRFVRYRRSWDEVCKMINCK